MEEAYESLLGKVKAPRKNSRTKGANNERKLCKALQEWTGLEFARVPSSGGLRWKDGQNIVGDLVCTDPKAVFPFSVETKHYAKVTCVVVGTYLKDTCTMYKIWKQACRDAERENKIPICFIRTDKQKGWSVYLALADCIVLGINRDEKGARSFKTSDVLDNRYCNKWFRVFPHTELFKSPFSTVMSNYQVHQEAMSDSTVPKYE